MRFTLTVVCLVAVLATPLSAQKWTSRDGKYSTEAELIDYQDSLVVLKRASDGKVLRLPLSKLSLSDAKYVSEALKVLGRELDGLGPPATKASPGASSSENGAQAQPPKNIGAPSTVPRTSRRASGWQVQADPPSHPFEFDSIYQVSIPFAPPIYFPHTPSPYLGLGGSFSPKKELKIHDLRRPGQPVYKLAREGNAKHMALSPDGQYVADMNSTNQSVQIWSCQTGKKVNDFELPGKSVRIEHLAFADSQRLLITNSKNSSIEVREFKTSKRLTTIELPKRSPSLYNLVLSPGGAYLAVQKDDGIEIYDTRNGAVAGSISLEDPDYRSFQFKGVAFSQDGSELAVAIDPSGPTIQVKSFSMSDGKMVVKQVLKDLPLAGALHNNIQWFADKSGWYWSGGAVIDRKVGGPILKEKSRRSIG